MRRARSSLTRSGATTNGLLGALGIVTLVAVVGLAMSKPLSHDEHQFVSSAALLARDGLLPYRDFPYFHMPDLVFVYAALFSTTRQLLFFARAVSAACACALLVVIGVIAYRVIRGTPRERALLAAGCVLLLALNPLFTYTAGLAWNHDLSVLLAVGSLLALVRGLWTEGRAQWLFASGVLLGLALGTRLSFAPLVVPLLAAIWIVPSAGRLRLASMFSIGLVLASLPWLVLLAIAPAQFVLGNLTYAELNTLYREQNPVGLAMSLPAKVDYIARNVADQPGNVVLAVAVLLFALPHLRLAPRSDALGALGIWLVALCLPFLLIGALAPTPSFFQYFYALVPFLVLSVIFGLGCGTDRLSGRFLAAAVLISGVYVAPQYARAWPPTAGAPIATQRVSDEIAQRVGTGRVLTLAPILVQQAGASIYPALATGPFAWRVGAVSERELAAMLRIEPPAGVLVGYEGELENAFIEYARTSNYQPVQLSNGSTLWVRP